jgi:hypothetical protein
MLQLPDIKNLIRDWIFKNIIPLFDVIIIY